MNNDIQIMPEEKRITRSSKSNKGDKKLFESSYIDHYYHNKKKHSSDSKH